MSAEEELAAVAARNDARLAALEAKGVGVAGRDNHYATTLLEALCGPGVVMRCRLENEQWFAGQLDDVEEKVAKIERERVLLHGLGPNGNA